MCAIAANSTAQHSTDLVAPPCHDLFLFPLLRKLVPLLRKAGYETSANALAFAIYCLATHPEAEAALLAEIDAFGAGKVCAAADPAPARRLPRGLQELPLLQTHPTPTRLPASLLPITSFCPSAPHRNICTPRPSSLPTQQEPGLDDLPRFPYVEATINEALRMYPPAHTSNRDSTSSTGCTIAGADGRRWHIPPGTWVHFNIWGLHHSEEHWQQPYAFR